MRMALAVMAAVIATAFVRAAGGLAVTVTPDRKSTRLNSSH